MVKLQKSQYYKEMIIILMKKKLSNLKIIQYNNQKEKKVLCLLMNLIRSYKNLTKKLMKLVNNHQMNKSNKTFIKKKNKLNKNY